MIAPHDSATAKAYNRTKLLLSVSSTVLSLLFLLALLLFDWSTPLADLATHAVPGALGAFLLFAIVIGLMEGMLGAPLAFYSGFILEHRYKLSNQTLPRYLIEQGKGLLVSVPLLLLLLGVFYWCLMTFGALWWLPVASVLTLLSVILARLAPVLIFPLFYTFTPLEEGDTRQRILQLTARAGLTVAGVFSFNLSKNTRKANAGFTGIGHSRRIILADTLLREFPPEEVEGVFAHELGHYVHHHIRVGILLGILLSFGGLFLASQLYERSLSLFGFVSITQISAMPLLALWLSLFGAVTAPLGNMLSRHHERVADRYAARATGNGRALASALRRLSAMNLADPDPHPLVEFFFYSHPAIARRIRCLEAG